LGQRSGRLPILSAKDLICVVEADGWERVPGGRHYNYKHPTKAGKVSIDEKWEHVKVGSWVFRSVLMDQAGLTRKEFEDLYWEHCR
jgi:predicted RNA binding protein YcfA (HicA-like mRNA interferase family)